jgi:PII-like signaling protein
MTALRIRVYVGERDHHHGQPLYSAVVQAARKAGLAGATVFKGIEGYGSHSVVHAARIVDLSSDLPILIEIVDEAPKIEAFVPALTAMVEAGLVTLERIEVIYQAPQKPTA